MGNKISLSKFNVKQLIASAMFINLKDDREVVHYAHVTVASDTSIAIATTNCHMMYMTHIDTEEPLGVAVGTKYVLDINTVLPQLKAMVKTGCYLSINDKGFEFAYNGSFIAPIMDVKPLPVEKVINFISKNINNPTCLQIKYLDTILKVAKLLGDNTITMHHDIFNKSEYIPIDADTLIIIMSVNDINGLNVNKFKELFK